MTLSRPMAIMKIPDRERVRLERVFLRVTHQDPPGMVQAGLRQILRMRVSGEVLLFQ